MKDLASWLPVAGILAGLGIFFWLFGRWLDRWTRAQTIAASDRRKVEWEQERKEHDEFRQRAKHMRAKVLSRVTYGRRNLMPLMHIRLRVDAPEGPYEVEMEETLDYDEPLRFREGADVDVLVDPDDREHVEIS